MAGLIRVAIVDDHPATATGLASILSQGDHRWLARAGRLR
jgi:DNA-binding NarL/FixJ family response regulator